MSLKGLSIAVVSACSLAALVTSPAAAAPTSQAVTLNWCAWPNTSGGEREYHVTLEAAVADRAGPNSVLRINRVTVEAPNGETAPFGQQVKLTVRVTTPQGSGLATRSGSFQVNSMTTVLPASMTRPLRVPDSDFYVIEVTKARLGKVNLSCTPAP